MHGLNNFFVVVVLKSALVQGIAGYRFTPISPQFGSSHTLSVFDFVGWLAVFSMQYCVVAGKHFKFFEL